jgi:hypothetical protein
VEDRFQTLRGEDPMMKTCSGKLLKREGQRGKGMTCGGALYVCERCHKEGCWHKEANTCANQALSTAAEGMKRVCVACGMSVYRPL